MREPSAERTMKFRFLDKNEIPEIGDEALFPNSDKWEKISIPSMWLAGGRRIKGIGVKFRRRIK